ncbi:MAG: DeoR/GlpR transcriptional regulator [Coriobacteriaceae bacterium]|uniref:DeoR/GlpR family DNA-binding transcription regulator n=1 Tax=Atopobium sp. oral taxon 416 TaxID=712157 RepID=UPI000FF58CAC|nr:DeoR/GlpR family DNA-binding transcription regulator [Atopobium sp. oral taxon 416]QUC03847.1 DeoR/GlpR transcriptional regulator [Atopobium sp. oral taxon 416]QUC04085.1 DeoR/GlpR transcriptional regulator [Atopobium sp. oral taxon 416]RRF99487.1 MAG: DeoR/GlpR transcriptional regulator [Coriobacteriaceae bacterium]
MTEFAEERRTEILKLLDKNASVQVSEIAQQFGVSRVTARSDLDTLAKDGKLRRTHGGAVSLGRALTVSVQDKRMNVNVEAKRLIAERAAEFVQDSMSVLVDTGTTGLALVRALRERRGLMIITADLTIADYVDRSLPESDVFLLGGKLRKGHRYVTGPATVRALSTLHPDISFVCPTAYSSQNGFATNFEGMAQLKQAFLKCAAVTYVMMDAEKINAPGLFSFGFPKDADAIICDSDPIGIMADATEDISTRLILAK